MTTATVATPESLQAAVKAQLQKISIANGYKSDVGKVYRVPFVEDQLPDTTLPVLNVLSPPNAHRFSAMSDRSYRGEMRLLIGGMVNVGQSDLYDEDRAMALNRLLEDTIDALLEDPRFGFGPSVDSVLESGDDVIDMDRGFGVFALQMHVTYHFTRGTL